jgi:hypothetical protein
LHETFSKIIEKGDLKAVVYLDKNFVPSSLMSAMDHTKAILTDLALKHPGISLLCRNFAILPPK